MASLPQRVYLYAKRHSSGDTHIRSALRVRMFPLRQRGHDSPRSRTRVHSVSSQLRMSESALPFFGCCCGGKAQAEEPCAGDAADWGRLLFLRRNRLRICGAARREHRSTRGKCGDLRGVASGRGIRPEGGQRATADTHRAERVAGGRGEAGGRWGEWGFIVDGAEGAYGVDVMGPNVPAGIRSANFYRIYFRRIERRDPCFSFDGSGNFDRRAPKARNRDARKTGSIGLDTASVGNEWWTAKV